MLEVTKNLCYYFWSNFIKKSLGFSSSLKGEVKFIEQKSISLILYGFSEFWYIASRGCSFNNWG